MLEVQSFIYNFTFVGGHSVMCVPPMCRWFASGLPMTGDYDGKAVGRPPAAVDVQQ